MTIVLPIVVYAIILNTVYKDQHLTNDQFFAVRWISFGVFIGTILLFLVPLFIWKWIVSDVPNLLALCHEFLIYMHRVRYACDQCLLNGQKSTAESRVLQHLFLLG